MPSATDYQQLACVAAMREALELIALGETDDAIRVLETAIAQERASHDD